MNGPFEKFGLKLIGNGHGIVPIPAGGKSPAIKGFAWQQDYARTPEQFNAMLGKEWGKHGVGIVTKVTPAIDIDVLDEDVVQHMLDWIEEHIGVLPQRIGKAPKTLLMFGVDTPFGKIVSNGYFDPENPERTPDKKWMRIEVLGDGQQFVAFHTHPETGQPYHWVDEAETPLTNHSMELQTIGVDDLQAICREFERHVESLGWEKKSNASSASGSTAGDADYDPMLDLPPPSESTHEVERVKSALEAIKPHISDYGYEQWLELIFALKWTGWDCAEELARDISEASDKHTDEHFNRTWKGAEKKTERNRKVTLASLFQAAKAHGWDATRTKTEEQELEDFERVMRLAMKLDGLDEDEQGRMLPKIIRECADANLTNSNEDRIIRFIAKITKFAMGALRKDLQAAKKDNGELATHASYAQALMRNLKKESGVMPIGVEGQIFAFDEDAGVWRGKVTSDFAVEVAREFDGRENCTRRTDYTAIAQQAYAEVSQGKETFFTGAPVGLACKGRFYKVDQKTGEITKETLDADHRQRVAFDIRPVIGPMPAFERLLHDCFEGNFEEEQIALLQECMGAILLGIFARYEKVLMMKGPGRAGKGTMLKIIESLIPEEARSAVSPFKWDSEYYVAHLAGSRLNVVGELPDDEAIPAAHFKTVTGRDTLTGRHPTHRPFNFRNEAAHVFNANHFIFTKDHSEAFYTRWILMSFQNSRIGREAEQDVNLAERIIEEERPAIMAWALQGAKRLIARGHFQLGKVQEVMMASWQKRTSTLMEFLTDTDVCQLGDGPKFVTVRSFFYKSYSDWCKESNRKPLGKQRLYDELDSPAIGRLGVASKFNRGGVAIVTGLYIYRSDEGAMAGSDDEDDGEL